VALRRLRDSRWAEQDFTDWAPLAYLSCVNPSEQAILDDAFLAECAAYDVACARRSMLADALEGWPSEGPQGDMLDWARRCTLHSNDELYELGREACAWTFQTPAEAARDGTPSQRIAAGPLPERADEVFRASKDGFKALGSDPSLDDGMVLHLFDYKARQLLGVDFLRFFFLSDLLPGAALEAIRQPEALGKPPPRVVRLRAHWLVCVGGRVRSRHARAAGALAAWLDAVHGLCDGAVFLNKKISPLAEDIRGVETPADAGLSLATIGL